ncbi:60 kDa inner membrane insertion protein [methanotrophic bacterial endosymbiont of Bathymodiolus sp.]|nr:60 kDa inner membrane insertion protein [methanotrophic bacterial endosymbiont of Bathymodiolus sp.]
MENIRFVLIVILSMISIMLWEAWQVDYDPKPEVTAEATIDANGNSIDIDSDNNQDSAELPFSENVADNIIVVTTDVYRLEIDTQGGTLRNLELLDYTLVKGEEAKIRLFNSSAENLFLGQSGLLTSGQSTKLPNHNTELSSAQASYQLKEGENTLTVPLTWTDNNGISYTKNYLFTRGKIMLNHC